MDEGRFAERVSCLCSIALRRLPRMLDPATGLFVFRVDGPALLPAGASVAYSAMSLLGLQEAERHALSCSLDQGRVFRALESARPALDNCGHLGLVAWAAAEADRPLAERAVADLLSFGRFTRTAGGPAYHATELAWVILGLGEALERDIGPERAVRARLEGALSVLLRMRGPSGLFGYASPASKRSPLAWVRGRLGFFDAQAYGILALLRVAELLGDTGAQSIALQLGRALLRLQGPKGQWPWHYEIERGEVVDMYPVYAVHQDGMAPMALLRLERATGLGTRAAVAKGLEWLFGDNELEGTLVDRDRATLWRSVRRRSGWREVVYPLKLARLAGARAEGLGRILAQPGQLEVDREFRPYHFGWLLYAFARVWAEQRAGRASSRRPRVRWEAAGPHADGPSA